MDQTDIARKLFKTEVQTLGIQHDLDARCITNDFHTSATFENRVGHQHLFEFAPILDEDMRPWFYSQFLLKRL